MSSSALPFLRARAAENSGDDIYCIQTYRIQSIGVNRGPFGLTTRINPRRLEVPKKGGTIYASTFRGVGRLCVSAGNLSIRASYFQADRVHHREFGRRGSRSYGGGVLTGRREAIIGASGHRRGDLRVHRTGSG